MKTFMPRLIPVFAACLLAAGCATKQQVRYTPPPPPSILDMKRTAQEASNELLNVPSITQFAEANGRLPRLDVGMVRNETIAPRVRIVVEQVTERIMEVLQNSGQITLVAHDEMATGANRLDSFLRDDKVNFDDQADFYLEGAIYNENINMGGYVATTYTFSMRLNDRNRTQVWKRLYDIAK